LILAMLPTKVPEKGQLKIKSKFSIVKGCYFYE
jgi:hypothetical protein